MKNGTVIAAMLAVAAGAASAGFDAEYTGFDGVNNAFDITFISTGGLEITQSYGAGHMNFNYTDMGGDRGAGQFSGGSFSSFCIELQNTQNGSRSYDIVDLVGAPNPSPGNGGPAYDVNDANEVHAIMAAAISLGWLESDLSDGADANNARMAAIQGMLWTALLDEATVAVNGSKTQVVAAMGELQTAVNANPTGRVAGLRAMVNADAQDQLYVVPLPPAALAGLLTLGGFAGVKRLRKS